MVRYFSSDFDVARLLSGVKSSCSIPQRFEVFLNEAVCVRDCSCFAGRHVLELCFGWRFRDSCCNRVFFVGEHPSDYFDAMLIDELVNVDDVVLLFYFSFTSLILLFSEGL